MDTELRALLKAYNYPLVHFSDDGVQVCYRGTWAFAKTLELALVSVAEKHKAR